MRKLSNYINVISPFIILLLLAKAISVIVLYFLPFSSIEKVPAKDITLPFRAYGASKAFDLKKKKPKKKPKKVVKKSPVYSLKNLKLTAVYKIGNSGGLIVVEDTKKKKTVLISLYEKYEGYTLDKIYSKYVVFVKGGAKYTLKLSKDVKLDMDIPRMIQNTTIPKATKQKNFILTRKIIDKYKNNFKEIWKNIVIEEVKRDKKIYGFKVVYFRKHSDFGKLGLKMGDIIVKVNDEPLNSYAQAFKIYKNIDNYTYITISVIRDGKEKEFDYEIK